MNPTIWGCQVPTLTRFPSVPLKIRVPVFLLLSFTGLHMLTLMAQGQHFQLHDWVWVQVSDSGTRNRTLPVSSRRRNHTSKAAKSQPEPETDESI